MRRARRAQEAIVGPQRGNRLLLSRHDGGGEATVHGAEGYLWGRRGSNPRPSDYECLSMRPARRARSAEALHVGDFGPTCLDQHHPTSVSFLDEFLDHLRLSHGAGGLMCPGRLTRAAERRSDKGWCGAAPRSRNGSTARWRRAVRYRSRGDRLVDGWDRFGLVVCTAVQILAAPCSPNRARARAAKRTVGTSHGSRRSRRRQTREHRGAGIDGDAMARM